MISNVLSVRVKISAGMGNYHQKSLDTNVKGVIKLIAHLLKQHL